MNANVSGPMGELLQGLGAKVQAPSPLSGLGLIPDNVRGRLASALGSALVGGLSRVAQEVAGELLLSSLLSSNPVTGIPALVTHGLRPAGWCHR